MVRYVGIDLHKRLIVACFLDENGQVLQCARLEPVDKLSLKAFCEKHFEPEDQVAMEVTTNCWVVAEFFKPYVGRVVVSNPMATKAIAEAKVKTDKVDAQVLANLLRCDFLPSVWIPDQATIALRELTGRRNQLVRDRSRLVCRVRSTLAMRLLDCPEDIPSDKGKAWIAKCELDEQGRSIIESEYRQIDAIQLEIEAIEKSLAIRVCENQAIKLLMTLPGVSQVVAQTVYSAIGDINRFSSPEKLASYLGLVPSTRQSASKSYNGSITKAGNVEARWALIQSAQCARNDLGPLGHFFNKVKRRKNHNVAVVAVARKLAMLAWQLLTQNRPYRYAKPSTVEAKLSKLRVAGTGKRRKTGPRKGVDSRVMRSPEDQNQRRTPGLPQVLAKEGLPDPTPLAPGERRMLEHTHTLSYYEGLQKETTRPKAPRKKKIETTG